eukprot:s38_g16.t1
MQKPDVGEPAEALEWVPTNPAEALLAKAADESVQQAMLMQGPGSPGVMREGKTAEAEEKSNHDQTMMSNPDAVNPEPPYSTEAANAATQQMQELDEEMNSAAANATDDAANPEPVNDHEAADAARQQMLQPEDATNPANATLADAANAAAVPVQPGDAMTPLPATLEMVNAQPVNETADAVNQQMPQPDDAMDPQKANVAEAAQEATVVMQESEAEAEASEGEAAPSTPATRTANVTNATHEVLSTRNILIRSSPSLAPSPMFCPHIPVVICPV